MASNNTNTIPLPTYLLSDEELYSMIDRIEEVAAESDHGQVDDRDREAITAIEQELAWRSRPIRLPEDPEAA